MASSTNSRAYHSPPTKSTAVVSSTPWTQIVACVAEPVHASSDKASAAEALLHSAGDVYVTSNKPLWNNPSYEALEVEHVMGADSWPALSEIAAKGPQKSSGDSSNSVPEPSALLSQGNEPSPSAHKQVTNNPHPTSIQNIAYPARQKSFKRHGGHASGNNGSSTQPPPPPPTLDQSVTVPSNQNTFNSQKKINLESGQKVASKSQSHGINDKVQHSNPHRRVNGNHQHGDGSYNHRYGARKDQDRLYRDWNSQRSFNGRDVHPLGTGFLPRGIIRHIPMPHASAPFIAPPLSPAMRPFGPPVSYPEFPFYYVPIRPESIRGMSIPYHAPAPHHLFMQYLDPELYSKVIHQIDYYFSNENLIKDTFLRKNMDEQGWVPIKLIAGFKKVINLSDNIAFITEAIRTSTVVEVKDDKVRRRNDWIKWIMPESLRIPSQSTYPDPGTSSEFAARIQKMNITGGSADIPSATLSSGDPPLQHPSH